MESIFLKVEFLGLQTWVLLPGALQETCTES